MKTFHILFVMCERHAAINLYFPYEQLDFTAVWLFANPGH